MLCQGCRAVANNRSGREGLASQSKLHLPDITHYVNHLAVSADYIVDSEKCALALFLAAADGLPGVSSLPGSRDALR